MENDNKYYHLGIYFEYIIGYLVAHNLEDIISDNFLFIYLLKDLLIYRSSNGGNPVLYFVINNKISNIEYIENSNLSVLFLFI
jgi:hypothetical protein